MKLSRETSPKASATLTSVLYITNIGVQSLKQIYQDTSNRYYDEFLFVIEMFCEVAESFRNRKNYEKCDEVLKKIHEVIKN